MYLGINFLITWLCIHHIVWNWFRVPVLTFKCIHIFKNFFRIFMVFYLFFVGKFRLNFFMTESYWQKIQIRFEWNKLRQWWFDASKEILEILSELTIEKFAIVFIKWNMEVLAIKMIVLRMKIFKFDKTRLKILAIAPSVEVKAYLHLERLRLKFCRKIVTLREIWLYFSPVLLLG